MHINIFGISVCNLHVYKLSNTDGYPLANNFKRSYHMLIYYYYVN